MPAPKKGSKAAKRAAEESAWEAKEAAATLGGQEAASEDSSSRSTKKSAFSSFSALEESLPDAAAANDDDGEGDLMAAIRAQSSKRKPKKRDVEPEPELDDEFMASKAPIMATIDDMDFDEPKPKKSGKKAKKGRAAKVDEDDELLDAAAASPVDEARPDEASVLESKAPTQASADDIWPEDEPKPKKGKKQKASKAAAVDEDDAPQTAAPPAEPVTESTEVDGDEPSSGVLSKKEKERLKKEKEKAKKKAQAAVKKAASGPSEAADLETPAEAAAEPIEASAAVDAEDGEEAAGASKDKKKKKKKAAEKAPAADTAEAGKPKKVNARIAALQAQLEAQKAAEEAFKREQEEARRREEEEERRAEEEARKAEEARKLKKEKEKAKRDQLKKEGKLLTPAQKREQQVAEARRQALLNSGVQIAGLQGDAGPSTEKKRNFSRKPGKQQKSTPAEAVPVEEAVAPEPVAEPEVAPAATEPEPVAEADDDGLKDEWDAESDKESAKGDVKASWDAESEDEAPAAKPAPAKTVTPAPAKPVNGTTAPAVNGKAVAAPKTNGKTVAEEESSEEESSDEDSDEDSDDDSDEESSSDDEPRQSATAARMAALKAEQAKKRQERIQQAQAAKSKDDLRSPICCILGHVDTGKTKLLDKIRQTNVQGGEAGGITQQIGATYFPMENIRKKTAVLGERDLSSYNLPGLLVIDTPGHESFTNLRSRGSSLCNIAVLVIDIMHGLEPQTIESIKLLREKKTPFIVALNKIDRLYDWQSSPDDGFQNTFNNQKVNVQREFKDRSDKAILALAEQGLNAKLYYENTNFARFVSVVPTSAVTGEGVPDMLMLLIKLTQERMSDRLMYISELECTVLEVKVIEGLGTTLDVVLSNGVLHEGDEIVVCSLNGAIVTNIRALLTPQPLKELRIKGQYVHHKMIKAAMGIKIVAPGLENAIAGSRLLVRHPDDDIDELKAEVFSDLTSLLDSVDRSGLGVWVQASTLGSLEALLDFLKSSKIPVAGINIGPVHKKDVVRAGVMLERAPEFAVMLCFDVDVDKEAEALAKEVGLRVFKADIIYHLFDAFTAYRDEILEAKRKESANVAVWPCRLKILKPFATRDPIILGCDIIQGQLRVGTPLCVVKYDADKKKSIVKLGRVSSIELNHKAMDKVTKKEVGAGIAVKIEHAVHEPAKAFGRHFDEKDELYSLISRASIDLLKDIYRAEVSTEEWTLLKNLKTLLDIPCVTFLSPSFVLTENR